MSRPRILSSIPQDPWDPARDLGNVTRELWDPARDPSNIAKDSWDPAREPWDIGWLLNEEQQEGPRGPRAQPPLSWGTPIETPDTLLDHHHHLQGTWTQEPADTEGEDLGVRRELAQEVEQPIQQTVPAFRGRSLGRSVIPQRPTRKIKGRPGYKTVLVPWMYAPVLYQAQSSPAEWSKLTPVSGGTGLRLTSDSPLASTGWYNQLNQQGDDESTVASRRPGSPPAFRRSTTVGCPRGGSTTGPSSTEARTTCPSRPATSLWEGEWTSWRTSPRLVTQTRQRSESHW